MGGGNRALMAFGLVVTLAACGSRVQPEELTRATEAPSPPAAVAQSSEAPGSPAPSGPAPAATATSSLPPLGQGPQDPASPYHNNGNIKIAFSSLCVRPGDLMVVTITTGANAGLAMSAVYADGSPHGGYNAGESDGQGKFVWRFAVTPDVPVGRARVYVMGTGTNWEGQDGGTADGWFEVAGSEGCVG